MIVAAAGLVSGHTTLADVAFLVAAVVFVLVALIRAGGKADPRVDGTLVALGLTLVALGLLVT